MHRYLLLLVKANESIQHLSAFNFLLFVLWNNDVKQRASGIEVIPVYREPVNINCKSLVIFSIIVNADLQSSQLSPI